MDQSAFGQFVAALWEEQGWQTQVKRDDGRVFVAVQRPATGEEGLLWAMAEGEIGGQEVQQFAKLCRKYEVEESAIVTVGSVSEHARKASQGTGVDVLDGDQIAEVLRRKELTHLAEEYGDASGGTDPDAESDDGDSLLDGLDDLPVDELKAVAERASALLGERTDALPGGAADDLPVSGRAVVAVVAVVALLAAGVLVGPSIPFLGGGGGPVSAESTAPAGSNATLDVAWNAKVLDEIDPDPSDTKAYRPPQGDQFVVVRMSLNNTGQEKIPVNQSSFEFRTADRTYGHQPLADHSTFVGFTMSPGTNYVGWTVFAVPEGTSGTLVYDQNATAAPVTVNFQRDESLAVNVTKL
jgi:hypothetical protein